MDKQIVTFFQDRKAEISAIWGYLLPLILRGFWTSFKQWVAVFVFTLAANTVAVMVTYSKGDEVRITEFFPPNIAWGLLIVLGILFVYQSASTVALTIRDLQAHADKLTTSGLIVDIVPYPSDYIAAYGIRIRNRKPFNLEHLVVKILKYEVGKRDYTPHHLFPAPLAWLNDRAFVWATISLATGGENTAALFGFSEYEGKMSLYFPGPNGQPSEIKSMGEVESGQGVMFADFEIICTIEGNELRKPIRIRAQIDDQNPKVEIVQENH